MSDAGSAFALRAYRAAGYAIGLPLKAWLQARCHRGKEDAARLGERFGEPSEARSNGWLIWLHCASVGEVNAAWPLAECLRSGGLAVLVTTGTVTSAQLVATRLKPGLLHQYVPVDVPGAVRRFLDHWRPELALFVESELWPGIASALEERGVPLVLVNGRMSHRSFTRWRGAGPLGRELARTIDLCLAASTRDAERFRALGVADVVVTGNLKYDAPPPKADPVALGEARAMFGPRAIWLAASTHDGEEAAVIEANASLPEEVRPRLVIAPRHPKRGAAVAKLARENGLTAGRRSRDEEPGEIYVADTIGEMGLWYALASLCFVGGSLVPHGGQNPIEPAKRGVPILHGPHVRNFSSIYRDLDRANGAILVEDAGHLGPLVGTLMRDADRRRHMVDAARDVIGREQGALKRTIEALQPFLARSVRA